MLSSEDSRRYSRHLLIPEIGPRGQEAMRDASVLIVGAGGLGSPVALYLAAAGVGRIGLVDYDVVDETNLQRQILYGTKDIGRLKLEAARDRLSDLNPGIEIQLHRVRLDSSNARQIIRDYDLVADGSDNFATRYLVNDACILTGVPNAYASIYRFDGQVSVFGHSGGPCYRCLYPEPPPPGAVPSCADAGVLGVLPGILGCLQATEVIKMICNFGDPLVGRLLLVDAADMSFRTLTFDRDPQCSVCGDEPVVTELIDYEAFCNLPFSAENQRDRESSNATPTNRADPESNMFNAFSRAPAISVQELQEMRQSGSDHLLLDVRRPAESELASIGGTLIPLQELPDRLDELAGSEDRDVVVLCRSGGRSARAVKFLRSHGFERAVNLAGGILAWSTEIDDSIPTY